MNRRRKRIKSMSKFNVEFLDRLYSSRGVFDYIDLERKILANYIGVDLKMCEEYVFRMV